MAVPLSFELPAQEARPAVRIGRVLVHTLTLDETLAYCTEVVNAGRKASIFYVNAHAVNMAAENEAFRHVLNEASVTFCDGKAIQWAARFLGYDIPERYTPPDWVHRLGEMASISGNRLFFLGGSAGVAEAAADCLRDEYPGLEIGTHHGYFGRSGPENEEIVKLINEYRPNYLLVGFGMPEQELWISANLERLEVSVAMAVGGLFDFMSGSKRRGPRWLTDNGLEWLTRLVSEPLRLGRRYLVGNPKFVLRVLRQSAGRESK